MQEYNHTESQIFWPLYVILPFYRVIKGFVKLTVVTDVHVHKFYCMFDCKVVCSVLQDLCTGLVFHIPSLPLLPNMGLLEEKLWVTEEHWVPFPALLQLDVSSSDTSTFIIMADLCENDLSCQHIKICWWTK